MSRRRDADLPVSFAREARALAAALGVALVGALLVGCGARSGLELLPHDAASADAPSTDAGMRDGGVPDEGTVVRDAGCHSDDDCVDRVPCTRTSCGRAGLCLVTPDDTMCSDGLFCTGAERCDIDADCVTTPPSCADAIACSVDACDPDVDGCTHTPDDRLCPISHRCDLVRGCVARVLAIDVSGGLYDVEVPGAEITVLGTTDRTLADIALAADGTFYGAAYDELVHVDSTTGTTRIIATVLTDNFNAIDFGPDGELYGAARNQVMRIDVASGAVEFIAVLPTGYLSSGDLAFLPDGRMLLTATRTGGDTVPDELFELRLDGRAPRRIGVMGSPCVWGLAAFGTTIYGLTCHGEVLLVDPATGGSRVLSRAAARFGGAAAR